MSTQLTHGIVLAKEDYKEYDAKFTIYTLEHGKIVAILKGAKKITSKLNSHLEFFSVAKIMIASGVAVRRIAGAQIEENFGRIILDTGKTIIALYFLEVINLLIRYDFKDDEAFEIIYRFLKLINNGQTRQDDLLLLNKSLFELLDHLGYRPEITSVKQKGLIVQFNKLIQEVAEREVKSYAMLSRLFS